MTSQFKKLTLTLLCLTAAGAVLAAEPVAKQGATPAATRTKAANEMSSLKNLISANPQTPVNVDGGKLSSVETSSGGIFAGTEMTFDFKGTGFCKLELNAGDGGAIGKYQGTLPFSGKYTYSVAAMAGSDTAKSFPLTINTLGKCVNQMASNSSLDIYVEKPQLPKTITSISHVGNTVAGAPTLLTVNGTGNCKYHLSYVNLDASGGAIMKQYPMVPKSSSAQTPFPMKDMQMLDATPAGSYKWTAAGVDGCTGNVNTTFTVQ